LTIHLPGHYSESLKKIHARFDEVIAESYDQIPTMIPELAEVRPLRTTETELPLWRQKTIISGDYELEERDPGEAIMDGAEQETRVHIFKTRLYSKKWSFPRQIIQSMGWGSIMGWAEERAQVFGEQLALKKEREFARLWNRGGFTAGDNQFNNHVPGAPIQGIQNGLIFDGQPWFALTGNDHVNWIGTSYFNAVALALTEPNLRTVKTRLQATIAFDELDREFAQQATTILVHPSQVDQARAIVRAQALAGTDFNDANPHAGLEVISWNLLEDTDAWYLMARQNRGAAGKGPRGVIVYDDDRVETWFEHDGNTDSFVYYANAYMALGIWDWRTVVSSNLQTS